MPYFKGALCSFGGRKFSINEVIIQTQIYFFFSITESTKLSEENKVPEHDLKLESWQGPPHIGIKQHEIVLVCLFSHVKEESLFIQFVQASLKCIL